MNYYKVVLLGDSAVGKTTIFSTFKLGHPDPNKILPTTGPSFLIQTIELSNNQKIDLQIWDTAGQERFKSLAQNYYRDAKVVIVCFEKIESIMNWVSLVREHNPVCHFIIALTKKDAISTEKCDEIEKQVKDLIAKEIDNNDFQKEPKNKTQYIATSGTLNENISELFQIAAEFYLSDETPAQANVIDINPQPNNDQQKDKSCC